MAQLRPYASREIRERVWDLVANTQKRILALRDRFPIGMTREAIEERRLLLGEIEYLQHVMADIRYDLLRHPETVNLMITLDLMYPDFRHPHVKPTHEMMDFEVEHSLATRSRGHPYKPWLDNLP